MTSVEDENAQNYAELSENLSRVDELTQRLVAAMAGKKNIRPELSGPDQQLYIKAASAYFAEMMSDPSKLIEQQVQNFRRSLEYWAETQATLTQSGSEQKPKPQQPGDKRFENALWEVNPYFNFVRQQYQMSSKAIEEAVDGLDELDPTEKNQISFFTRQMIDMLSPTNFLGTNPEALTKALESNGESLVKGLENLVRDLETNDGELNVTLSDPSAFEVGGNIATTPGSVVYQNRMFQLVHYTPTTEKTFKTPLLIVPPWINKFYILDLREKNSFIKYAVSQGFSVFVVSWVNPDESYKDVGFDTYVQEGFLQAVETVKKITASDEVNVIGYCIGGTLTATSLACMAKEGDKSVKTATFFTTLTDFKDSGELSVFIDDSFLAGIEKEVAEAGFLDSIFMSRAFSFLRSKDLVYGPAVRSYLMGEAPPAFDLLYWNSDSTNLPARMAVEYLRHLYQENRLSKGEFSILNHKLDLADIKQPIFAVATKSDHIAPWKSSFSGLKKISGDKTFVLAGSGHIAGIVNPADSKKYGHWINPETPDDCDKWFESATAHEGSWWDKWSKWLGKKSGAKIEALQPGLSPGFPVIEAAPGSYVKKRYK